MQKTKMQNKQKSIPYHCQSQALECLISPNNVIAYSVYNKP